MKNFIIVLLSLVLLTVFACVKPQDIGDDLFVGEQTSLKAREESIVTSTINEDSLVVYDKKTDVSPISFFCGDFDDPIFGNTYAAGYSQIKSQGVNPSYTDFKGGTLDSIVLTLRYDSIGYYGDKTASHGLEVLRVTEDMNELATYYSNKKFNVNATPIGGIASFKADLTQKDSLSFKENGTDVAYKGFYTLRMPLDKSFGQEIMGMDSLTYISKDRFTQKIKGICIRPTKQSKGMLSFFVNTSTSRVTLYYTKNSVQNQAHFFLNSSSGVVVPHMKQVQSSIVKSAINQSSGADSIAFIQGMLGTNMKITIPSQNLENLKSVYVNKAELTITAAKMETNNSVLYPLPSFLDMTYYLNGVSNYISDLTLDAGGTTPFSIYGGKPKTDETTGLTTYTFNISNHLQKLLKELAEKKDAKLVDSNIYIKVYNKSSFPYRGVFYGATHKKYPAKLKIAYTVF